MVKTLFEKCIFAIIFIGLLTYFIAMMFLDKNEQLLQDESNRQIHNHERRLFSMKDEKIRLVWDDFKQNHIKYFLTNEESWYKKLEEATLFLEKNKRRPNAKSKDEDEKILGSWISTQIRNHERRLQIMKDEKIYLVWDDFKQNHLKILFK